MENSIRDNVINNLHWRCIGPPRGGRVVAVAGHPTNIAEFYFGACAGGVWKTNDAGISWHNISDGYLNTASVGAIAVSDSDPNVIYVGTGESCIRTNVSPGDGVYKSTDGGRTWENIGLNETKHISQIRIDPNNADLVYVAALGHAFGENDERGVFRSSDGGENWEKVLFVSNKAGAADLSMDANNPRIIISTIWEAKRSFWRLDSGGPDTGIYITRDGGDNWTEITNNPGLPLGLKGRIGVTISAAKEGRIWATIESEIASGIYRSENYGDSWEIINDNMDLQGRPWYYQHIFADPSNADTVWILNFVCNKSVDGGKTFHKVSTPHGDNHALWIDPNNSNRMIEGNDGGANVTLNGGESWSSIYNQLTSQFYHVHLDNQFPYRVYGTQQDNSAISVPSRSDKGVIPYSDCYSTGTSESGWIVTDPKDSNIVYSGSIGSSPGGGGNLQRYDHNTEQVRMITVWPVLNSGKGADEMKYRFQWTYPIRFSPHDSNTLYVAGNVVFKSTNEGQSWEEISPDLTRNDKEKQRVSGGEITKDTSGAETYCTIFTFLESPYTKGLMWAGSDDGLIHITHDDGKNWNNVTPKNFPEWARIHTIEISPHNDSTVYVCATKNMLDDYSPIIFKTTDNGETWDRIDSDFPNDQITRSIRVDPQDPNILYVGTETGLYVTLDDGKEWIKINSNLPVVPVYDIAIRDNSIVLATHGRSFWILDDITAIQQLNNKSENDFLLDPAPVYRIKPNFSESYIGPMFDSEIGKKYQLSLGTAAMSEKKKNNKGEIITTMLDSGENPSDGVPIYFYIDKKVDQATISITDIKSNSVRDYSTSNNNMKINVGVNRFIWDMNHNQAVMDEDGSPAGPMALPGDYNVELKIKRGKNEISLSGSIKLIKDPRAKASDSDLLEQIDLLFAINTKYADLYSNVQVIKTNQAEISEWISRAESNKNYDVIKKAGDKIIDALNVIESSLIPSGKNLRAKLTKPIVLGLKLTGLIPVINSTDFKPTDQSHSVFIEIKDEIDEVLEKLRYFQEVDLIDFQELVEKNNIPRLNIN